MSDRTEALATSETGPEGAVGAAGGAPAQIVVHALWTDGALHLWAESVAAFIRPPAPADSATHPFAADGRMLIESLAMAWRSADPPIEARPAEVRVRLPADAAGRAAPSPRLAHLAGHEWGEGLDGEARLMVSVLTPAAQIAAADAPAALEALEAAADEDGAGVSIGESVRFFAAAARLLLHLLGQQRFVPMLVQETGGAVRGAWQPWLSDDAAGRQAAALAAAMPGEARCVEDSAGHDGWTILEGFLSGVGDALCRRVLARESMHEALDGRDPNADPQVAWLSGLLSGPAVQGASGTKERTELVRNVRRWVGGLEERGAGSPWRLLLRLSEPLDVLGLEDFAAPGDEVRWTLSLHLQSTTNPRTKLDAQDIWLLPGGGSGSASVEGLRIDSPQDVLLAELGRAARLYKQLEGLLEDSEPTSIDLSTSEAYKFFRELRPLLIEQGFGVEAPDWWDSPTVRLGARLLVSSEDVDFSTPAPGGPQSAGSRVGLHTLVDYRWQIAVGETTLTLEQFELLAAQHSPLVRLGGRWVEIRPEDVRAAVGFIRDNPGGKMEVGRALRLAYASDVRETGVPILGMDATGWVAKVFTDAGANQSLPILEPPHTFVGTLRPYQVKGLSWLAFLDTLGLGACLADDMGLGKTIQLLALMAHEREAARLAAEGGAPCAAPGPTLLVVPMSVVANWVHEARRFTPSLRVLVHHGPDRPLGDRLLRAACESDVVITTYALAHRDREHLEKVGWQRVVLDEAQNIKNPAAKQTRAVHAIDAPRRIALTGTPVENRLGELWSIMDFLNGGYLGSAGEFRRKFAVPVERYHDKHKASQLRGLVQPFVLRRLKTDPAVISDLPEKMESKEYCYLTPEQAQLYQACVSDMLNAADAATGIQRKGLVLAGLIKLKQVCNHPAQFLKESGDGRAGAVPSPARSGKCQRLIEMLEEVLAAGDRALVFTQFRQMGDLLASMLRRAFDREVLFLHGGTTAAERQRMIEEFQSAGGPPVFVLSLKAGGVGLNLTAANHVFHFDRWWNPAVEAQATDRAYRIGQTRTVQVHKFVAGGTLEEKIDQMIEEKTALASEIIGSGEAWLTDLSTGQLRDLLALRADAVGDDEE
ncbi:MAG: DEAD/DEAH box helicase [Phycisphaeraceae bacterium]|nr:DEAD/DEAH box helicase [Phycisphaeraceae bacterium]